MASRDLPGTEELTMANEMPDQQTDPQPEPADSGLRRMMLWVFGALLVTVVAAILVVEFTLRWFGER
jgi:hypothetical protein